ncbi:hypothetical protein GQ457_02G040680 [Hibiscus cannabinus]
MSQVIETYDNWFLTKSLKEDFDTGGIPIRIVQRSVPRMAEGNSSKTSQSSGKTAEHTPWDKRTLRESNHINITQFKLIFLETKWRIVSRIGEGWKRVHRFAWLRRISSPWSALSGIDSRLLIGLQR